MVRQQLRLAQPQFNAAVDGRRKLRDQAIIPRTTPVTNRAQLSKCMQLPVIVEPMLQSHLADGKCGTAAKPELIMPGNTKIGALLQCQPRG